MSTEDRNFRCGYYEKVGFGGIDEKKSLEILLREKPQDLLARLAQLASRYSLSSVQRKHVWQLLLDVVRPDNEISEIQSQVQRAIVTDIINGLKLMEIVDEDCLDVERSNNQSKLIVIIFLFETRQMSLNITLQVNYFIYLS